MTRADIDTTLPCSTAPAPLNTPLAVLISATLVAGSFPFPKWLQIAFACLASVVLLIYILSYVFCLLRHPDALRSETFTLEKMRIDHSMLGDSTTGIADTENQQNLPNSPNGSRGEMDR